jgi:hypothetical protein
MVDYLTQPSSAEGSISKIKKIRSELIRQKEEVSKKKEKFAKRTLGLETGLAIGNAALKGALDRYQLRNQPQINLLKGLQAQSKGVIAQDQAAMKKHGSVSNYIFSTLKDRYQEAVNISSGEDYVYSSDHWSDELNADVATKTKAYNDHLAAARRISDGDIDGAFKGLQEQALPSNLWQYFSRSAKQLVKGHNATTIKLKANQKFDKLINSPTFADYKDFQTQAKLYNNYFPGALQGILVDIDREAQAGTLQDRVAQTQFVSKVIPKVEEKIVDGKKSKVTTQRFVVKAVQTTPTGKLLESKDVLDQEFEGGKIPQALISSEQLRVYNAALSVKGQARLAQLMESNESYLLDSSLAYNQVLLEGNELGLKDGTNINSYVKPDLDVNKLLEGLGLSAGKAAQAYLAPVNRDQYMIDGKLDQEEYDKQVKIRDSMVDDFGLNLRKVAISAVEGVTTSNVIPALPKP